MGATAVLSPTKVTVQPGAEARCEVTVRNTSHVVEEMTFEILGSTATFARVEPARLSMFPGTESKVTIIFAPPIGSLAAAGTHDFAIKVLPKEDPEGSWVEEGELVVAAISDSLLELAPRTSRGRLAGRHEWAIDNRGNAAQTVTLRGAHADNLLTFEIEPSTFDLPPGGAVTGKLKVKPHKRFWKGPPRSAPFEVYADGSDGTVLRADAMYLQEAMLPKWLLRVLLLLGALALVLAVLFLTVIKPAITSEARAAAKKEVAPANAALTAADLLNPDGSPSGKVGVDSETGAPGTTTIPAAGEGTGAGAGAGGAAGGAAAAESAQAAADAASELLGKGPGGKARYHKRLAPVVDATNTERVGDKIPKDKVLDLTDIVFQNPNGDSGLIRVKREDELLIEINLDNFRDLDYHFVTGTAVKGDEQVFVEVVCRNAAGKQCTSAAYLTGTLFNVPSDAPATTAPPATAPATTSETTASETTAPRPAAERGVPPATFTTIAPS